METIGNDHMFSLNPLKFTWNSVGWRVNMSGDYPTSANQKLWQRVILGVSGYPKKYLKKWWVINMSAFYQNDPPQKKSMSSHPKWQLMATYPTVSWSSSSPCSTLDLPGTEEATLSWSVQSRPQWMQLSFWNEIAILRVSCRVTVIGKSYWKNHVLMSHVYSIFM